MGRSGSKPRAGAATTSAPRPAAPSPRSSSKGSIAPLTRTVRRTPSARHRSGTPTFAGEATTTEHRETIMLTHPTYDRLIALGLTGMARALAEQRGKADASALTFEERLALLIDREAAERHNKRLANRLKFAGLRQNAVVEDIDLHAARGLDRALLQTLIASDWIDRKL